MVQLEGQFVIDPIKLSHRDRRHDLPLLLELLREPLHYQHQMLHLSPSYHQVHSSYHQTAIKVGKIIVVACTVQLLATQHTTSIVLLYFLKNFFLQMMICLLRLVAFLN